MFRFGWVGGLWKLGCSDFGVQINTYYADDLVLLSENEQDLQSLLNVLYDWCYKCRFF